MKNLFLLPTDKPSRLWTNNLRRRLELDEFPSQHLSIAIHIYITSDEEIKEGDWVKLFIKHIDKEWIHKITKEDLLLYTDFNNEGAKIILTTDKDLIDEGIQAIDDEFLERFVKNPSCEEVKVNKLCYGALSGFADAGYKIIIPKEEPKQERMYSEEEIDKLISIIQWYDDNSDVRPDLETFKWYEQFKKKA